ncbi:hypothetical protein ABFS82_08G106600 [Erythranthe guttata]
MTNNTGFTQLLFLLQSIFSLPFLCFCLERNTISSGIYLRDPETIVSPQNVFKLGFFSPDNSTNRRYLGVFYTVSEETVVWVANGDNPLINDFSSSLTISKDGNLVLMNGINQTVWSTNISTKTTASIVQIQDTGNLILRDLATGNPIWESFSHPSNVFLPTMKISDNINTHEKVALWSWKSDSDPQVGNFSFGIDVRNDIVQMFIWNNGRPHWRSGPWDGDTFTGQFSLSTSPYQEGFSIGMDDRTGTVFLTTPERRFLNMHALNSSGNLMLMVWDDQRKNWNTFWMQPHTECNVYGLCGPFATVGSCNNDFYFCSCLRGFEPTNRDEWGRGNWSSGCERRIQLQCNYTSSTDIGDRFFRMESTNVPDSAVKFSNANEDVCRQRCLVNCSCIAYAYPPKIGCMFWTDSLIDIRHYSSSPGYGIDLYIRLSPSEFGIFMRRKDTKKGFETFSSDSTSVVLEDELEKVKLAEEFPLFTFETLANATDQFHGNNLLGKGGFGYVYEGILENGKEIAVKRLSAASGARNG